MSQVLGWTGWYVQWKLVRASEKQLVPRSTPPPHAAGDHPPLKNRGLLSEEGIARGLHWGFEAQLRAGVLCQKQEGKVKWACSSCPLTHSAPRAQAASPSPPPIPDPAQEGRHQDTETEVPQQTACLITTVQVGSWTPRQFSAPDANCKQATEDPWAAQNRLLQRQRPKKSSGKKQFGGNS